MAGENNLDNIISEDEASIDKTISSIFKFSAKMKRDLKLVKDPNGFELYYLSISPNNDEYLKKIKNMDLNKIDTLYAALKHPVMFADFDNKKVEYLNLGFQGLDVVYDIKKARINEKEAKRLSDLYSKAEKVDSKEDLKYAKMYDVSYRIKDKSVRVVMTTDDNEIEFYLTELSKLGKDGKRIIDYLGSLKSEDASYFISISSLFSIIDTKNNVLYAMESSKDKDGKEIVKMLMHDKKEGKYDLMYDIVEKANKNPNEKMFLINNDQEETYHPNSKPPSDMYA